MSKPLHDAAPAGNALTDYDLTNLRLFMRLLDAETAGADWKEVVSVLFGLDAAGEPDRTRRVYDSHLSRAHWLTETGYRSILALRR